MPQLIELNEPIDIYTEQQKQIVGQYKYFITDYKYEYYEGDGQALGIYENGDAEWYDLCHCSCYGPLEPGYFDGGDISPSGKITVEEILKSENIHDNVLSDSITNKVIELYGEK